MWWFTGGVSRRAQSGGWCRRCGWAVAGQGVMNRNDTRGGAGLLGGRGWWFLGLPAGKGKRFCRGGRYRAGRLGRVRRGACQLANLSAFRLVGKSESWRLGEVAGGGGEEGDGTSWPR